MELGVTATLLVPSSDINGTFEFQYAHELADLYTSLNTMDYFRALHIHLWPTSSWFNVTSKQISGGCDFTLSGGYKIDDQKEIYGSNLLFDSCTKNISPLNFH